MPVWKASREGIRERGTKRGGKEGVGALRGMRQTGICMLSLVASPLCVAVDMKSAAHFVLSLSQLSVFIYRMLQIGSWKASRIHCWSLSIWFMEDGLNGGMWVIRFEGQIYCRAVSHWWRFSVLSLIFDKEMRNIAWSHRADTAD